jgi:enolase-phosphatase E1
MFYLLDIEGTCLPKSFVYDGLYPFAQSRMAAYLRSHAEGIAAELTQFEQEREQDVRAGRNPPALLLPYIEWLVANDRKSTPLKSIQGMIWAEGFEQALLVSPLYDDVGPAIERWKVKGHTVAIYSSGSVQAQKLIFGHSRSGDLTLLIDAYFDTTTGPKKQAESYLKISAALRAEPKDIIFVSDSVEELSAAHQAGVQTVYPLRNENSAPAPPFARAIATFHDLHT